VASCATLESRDARAISHHYDVSNRFYELMLGRAMAYSCALFTTRDATLEDAQRAKFDLICRKLDLKPGQHLLDIGAGWVGWYATPQSTTACVLSAWPYQAHPSRPMSRRC